MTVAGPSPTHPAPVGRRRTVRELSLVLLGGFELIDHDAPVVLPLSAQRLIALLAIHSRLMSRSRAAGTLWPDTTEQHALGNLRSVLWRLHRSPRQVLESPGGCLGLSAGVSVDLGEMESHAARIRDPGHRIEDAEVNKACHWGDVLPDWSDDWLLIERERFRQLRLHTMEVLSERLAAEGRFGQAVMAGLAAVAAEPLRESAQRILIKAHLSEGNRSEATRQYALYRNLLTSDLGLEPSRELRALLGA